MIDDVGFKAGFMDLLLFLWYYVYNFFLLVDCPPRLAVALMGHVTFYPSLGAMDTSAPAHIPQSPAAIPVFVFG